LSDKTDTEQGWAVANNAHKDANPDFRLSHQAILYSSRRHISTIRQLEKLLAAWRRTELEAQQKYAIELGRCGFSK
jgi:hypothetical protein